MEQYPIEPAKAPIKYYEVINYLRSSKLAKSHTRTCVMCGKPDGTKKCVIPTQNKDVCKVCDKEFWFCKSAETVVKFCKGCKNFVPLANFEDKPEASKCGTCRDRGRQNYFSRKRVETPPPSSSSATGRSWAETFGSSDNARGPPVYSHWDTNGTYCAP